MEQPHRPLYLTRLLPLRLDNRARDLLRLNPSEIITVSNRRWIFLSGRLI